MLHLQKAKLPFLEAYIGGIGSKKGTI